ncbi:MAG: OmpH family outer membrane protein [Deltaproteobacteria bacterium]|nr:OmpH family outer membrane protein [Deltaproteobacteria bacterium]
MRITSIIIFALVMGFVTSAYGQGIAWFNPSKVLKNSSSGKAVLAKQKALQLKFENERKSAERPLQVEKATIEKEWKNFQENQSVLNAKERKKRLGVLKGKYDAWVEKVKKIQVKLAKVQQKLAGDFQKIAEPFSNKLKKAAASVAAANGYAFIIAHDPANPQVLLYAKPSLDVTDKLISILSR